MTYRHVYAPKALEEYKEAVSWYLKRSEKAAENFIKEIDEKTATICKYPFRYRNTYKEFREAALKKYPFSIVYLLDEQRKQVIIFSIFHQKRSPRKKFLNK